MSLTWSYSSLGLFQLCPRKYYHLRVVKDYSESETEDMRYGKVVHKVAEDYIGKDEPIPPQFLYIKEALDVLKAIPGEKLCEYKMGLDKELNPCDFFSSDVWFRGVCDLVILDVPNKKAYIVDYKTGKSARYADTKQLELMALALFRHFPEIEHIKAGLSFLVCEDFVKAEYHKETASWAKWQIETDRLDKAYKANVWNAKPNFTCKKYCIVDTCEHNGKGSYR